MSTAAASAAKCQLRGKSFSASSSSVSYVSASLRRPSSKFQVVVSAASQINLDSPQIRAACASSSSTTKAPVPQ